MPVSTLLSWSSGKDSAWALHRLRQDPNIDVTGLLTSIAVPQRVVGVHGTPEAVVLAQSAAAQLPLLIVELPWPCSNIEYEARMRRALMSAHESGMEAIAFGDLFLEDVRDYRLKLLEGTGLDPLFPLWGEDTRQLASEMIAGGLRARVCAVDEKKLGKEWIGREFDAKFLTDLPADVDPCGERGEYHTVVWDGPMFRHPVREA